MKRTTKALVPADSAIAERNLPGQEVRLEHLNLNPSSGFKVDVQPGDHELFGCVALALVLGQANSGRSSLLKRMANHISGGRL